MKYANSNKTKIPNKQAESSSIELFLNFPFFKNNFFNSSLLYIWRRERDSNPR